MGSAASRSSFRLSVLSKTDERLNEEQCRALVRDKFDQEVFDELKDDEGLVRFGQLLFRYRKGADLDGVAEDGSDSDDSTDNEQEDESNGHARGKEEVGEGHAALLRRQHGFSESRDLDSAGAALEPPVKGNRRHRGATLHEKRAELQSLQNSAPQIRAEMVAAASGGMDTSSWKDQLDSDYERTSALETEIEDMEESAWEPVLKGDTVLFYHNW